MADLRSVAAVLSQQRNQAMDMVAQLSAEVAQLREEAAARDKEIAALKVGAVGGKADGGGS